MDPARNADLGLDLFKILKLNFFQPFQKIPSNVNTDANADPAMDP
jgi:hypothetical protein